MKVALIHQNFPGQFRYLAPHLAGDPQVQLIGIGRSVAPGSAAVRTFLPYDLARPPSTRIHPYVRPLESAVLYGQAVARLLIALREKGWRPDVAFAHSGWGESLFVRDVFPDARLIVLAEFYDDGIVVGFDPELPASIDDRMRVRTGNAHLLSALDSADAAVAAMPWQRRSFPEVYRSKIVVNHEGVDTLAVRPDPAARLTLPDGTVLRAGDPVVTYVARNLEPHRGFHIFMRAAARVLERVPGCRIVLVGGDAKSYSRPPKEAATWREQMLREVPLDPGRVSFLGRVPHKTYLHVLQVSAAHVYLTYPFVLSWSLLEAMAAGCRVIASRTGPVLDVIEDGRNGLLVDFFDVEGIAEHVTEALTQPRRFEAMRVAARATVEREFDVTRSLGRYREILLGK